MRNTLVTRTINSILGRTTYDLADYIGEVVELRTLEGSPVPLDLTDAEINPRNANTVIGGKITSERVTSGAIDTILCDRFLTIRDRVNLNRKSHFWNYSGETPFFGMGVFGKFMVIGVESA